MSGNLYCGAGSLVDATRLPKRRAKNLCAASFSPGQGITIEEEETAAPFLPSTTPAWTSDAGGYKELFLKPQLALRIWIRLPAYRC